MRNLLFLFLMPGITVSVNAGQCLKKDEYGCNFVVDCNSKGGGEFESLSNLPASGRQHMETAKIPAPLDRARQSDIQKQQDSSRLQIIE